MRSVSARPAPYARSEPDFFIVATDMRVVLAASQTLLTTPVVGAIREATRHWVHPSTNLRADVISDDGYLLHLQSVVYLQRPGIGIVLEPIRERRALQKAALRYGLTPREVETLELVVRGCSSREIAESLHIATSTVKQHVRCLLQKTRLSRRTEFAIHLERNASQP